MLTSYAGPLLTAGIAAVSVYYLFRILVTSDAGQLKTARWEVQPTVLAPGPEAK